MSLLLSVCTSVNYFTALASLSQFRSLNSVIPTNVQLLRLGSLTNAVSDLPAMYSSTQAILPSLHASYFI